MASSTPNRYLPVAESNSRRRKTSLIAAKCNNKSRPCKSYGTGKLNDSTTVHVSSDVSRLEKNNLLIISDSHGRDIFKYFDQSFLGDFNIFSLCRHSAKLYICIEDIECHAKGFTLNDYVVCCNIWGSNDIRPGINSILTPEVKFKI